MDSTSKDSASQVLKILKGHDKEVLCVRISPDGSKLVSASKDGTVRVRSSCWFGVYFGAKRTMVRSLLRFGTSFPARS